MPDMESTAKARLTKVVRKVVHDIRGPLINVRGFADLLDDAVEELVLLIDSQGVDLSEVVRGRMQEIVGRDINPMLTHIRASLDQLDTRIDRIVPDSVSSFEESK